jgi:(1->4)-alpha-D-glucan 1-alpha-D-glucosylmutase
MQRHWPGSMLCLSTHDTKRSEDVRARLFALSEWPERWARVVQHWMERGERRREVRGRPDRNAEYLLYQTLVGAHPLPLQRACDYMIKATREAGVHTSWTEPNPDYERALLRFIRALYADEGFLGELRELAGELTPPGRVNSLAQKLIQLTAPGVPDLYQGTELWDHSLVDPDNRRPVDFALRRRSLEALAGLDAAEIWARADEGLPKLWVIREALALRAARPHVFGPRGDYAPLTARGPAAEHVVAFCRGGESISVVPRLVTRLLRAGGFRDTVLELPPGSFCDLLCGRRYAGGAVPLAELLARFPVALLAREEAA